MQTMPIIMKQLTHKEKQILDILIKQVIAAKKAKQQLVNDKNMSQRISKQSSKKPKKKEPVKALQADRYLRMCFLMFRQGLYGTVQNPCKSYSILYQHLSFYQNTYFFRSFPQPTDKTSKIQKFVSIEKGQLQRYLNKKTVRKIQKLAQSIHTMIQDFITMYNIDDRLKDEKNWQLSYLQPLRQIVYKIEQNYQWDRWKHQPKINNMNIIQHPAQQQKKEFLQRRTLQQLNYQSIDILSKISQKINSIYTNPLLKKVIDKYMKEQKQLQTMRKVKQIENKHKPLQQIEQNRREKTSIKSKQKQLKLKQQQQQQMLLRQKTIQNKQQTAKYNKIDNKQRQTQIIKQRLQYYEMGISSNQHQHSNLLQFCQKLSQKSQQSSSNNTKSISEQKLQSFNLKQKLISFCCGNRQNAKISSKSFDNLNKKNSISQISSYQMKMLLSVVTVYALFTIKIIKEY